MNAARHYSREARRAQRARRLLARRLSHGLLGLAAIATGMTLVSIVAWAASAVPVHAGSGLFALSLATLFAGAGLVVVICGSLMICEAATQEVL